ncbi:sugar transferase [Paenibacillus sp. J5C_2022]|uniref:sugar transferase n=1 Tax=Paenibacillus sp. J5C2022 TaxID=2977129 RepID=UPI0021D00EE0|nr:sugar transferase [Paenibacillus sp. J5C2022]MCU6708782.1 sugar transferase [Paenibacillus sp. J5C2022]
MKFYKGVKFIVDILLSFVAIVVLSPIMMIIALLIKFDSKGPVFFKQKRVGKNKKHFYILKFRTMRTDAPKDTPTHMLQNPTAFITRLGQFLRKSSLDELPQIINILKGEMSIIGPRPALWNQYDLIEERDKYGANDIYPGLTGWAQINGRDELPVKVKAKLDGEYVEKLGVRMDFRCFLFTLVSVLKREGIVEGGTRASRKEATVSNIMD